jgi:hypothetical protein
MLGMPVITLTAPKRRKKADGPFPLDTALDMPEAGGAVLQAFRGLTRTATRSDRDSVRGHHDRFVYWRHQPTRYSARN